YYPKEHKDIVEINGDFKLKTDLYYNEISETWVDPDESLIIVTEIDEYDNSILEGIPFNEGDDSDYYYTYGYQGADINTKQVWFDIFDKHRDYDGILETLMTKDHLDNLILQHNLIETTIIGKYWLSYENYE